MALSDILTKIKTISQNEKGFVRKSFCRDFVIMLEISRRNYFSKQYLSLLFSVVIILLGLYPGGMMFELEFDIASANELRYVWNAEWVLQNMMMSIMFTAVVGMVILRHVQDF